MAKVMPSSEQQESEENPRLLDIDAVHKELRDRLTKDLAQAEEQVILFRGAIQGIDLFLSQLVVVKEKSDG